MIRWDHFVLLLLFLQITGYKSTSIKDVKADRRLLTAVLGYRKGLATQRVGRPLSDSEQETGTMTVLPQKAVDESKLAVGLPASSQPARHSTPPESVQTEVNEGGGMAGNSGVKGSNYKPGVIPTSVPGTGDLERATNSEKSHISPLIEQHEAGSQGSLVGLVGQQMSPTPAPHCPPCTGNEVQTQSFEAPGGTETLPVTPIPSKKGQPDKPGSSAEGNSANEPDKQVNQANPAETSKPASSTEVNPVRPDNPVANSNEPEKPNEQVVNQGNPVQPGKPTGEANNLVKPEKLVDPGKPSQSPGDTPSCKEKQCPPCSCPNKESGEQRKPESSLGSQPQSAEASNSSPSGNEVSQGQPSGKAVSQGVGGNKGVPQAQASESSNVVSPESAGVAGRTSPNQSPPESQSGRESGGNKLGSQGVNEGGNNPSVNQPTRENESGKAGNPSGTSTDGGAEGSPTGSQGGSEGSQRVSGTASPSQSAGNSELTGTTQSTQGGQTGATQGASEQGGTSGSIPEGGAFVEGLDIFQQSAVEAHNKYRKLHSSPPLKLNGEMAAQATEYAKTLAKSSINDVEHSLKSSRDNQGENIYAACGTNPSGADVSKEWYKELCNYNYKTNAAIDATKPIGHFTQTIWKSSTEFGIGRAYGAKQDCVYIVARYKPPGNIIGSESASIARGTMDGEYCGREFMALNKQENGGKEGTVRPGQSTNEDPQQESGVNNQGQNGNAGNSEARPSEENSVSQGIKQNSESSNTAGTNPSESSSLAGNQGNTDNVPNKAIQSDFTRNSLKGSPTQKMNEHSQMNAIVGRSTSKGIRTPLLPAYLQKSVFENTNKRYKGLRNRMSRLMSGRGVVEPSDWLRVVALES